MKGILETVAPVLVPTTAIMTTVIILIIASVYLIAREKKINRPTIEKLLKLIRLIVILLIALEFYITGGAEQITLLLELAQCLK